MSSHKSRNKGTIIENKIPVTHLIAFIGLGLVMFFSSFQKALFGGGRSMFEGPIFTWSIFIFIILILLSAHRLFEKEAQNRRDSLVHLSIYLLPLAYWISSFWASSEYNSSFFLFIQVAYLACFLIGYYLTSIYSGAAVLANLLLILGHSIVIFGLMNWFGDASLWGLLDWSATGGGSTYRDAVLNESGGRLSSVFQYPNSYAGFLIAVILSTLVQIVHSMSKTSNLIYSCLLIPAVISFILTLSRAAYLIFPVILVMTLFFLKTKKQIALVSHLVIAGLMSLSILNPITDIGVELQVQFDQSEAFTGWLILIGISFGFAFISFLLSKFLFKPKDEDEETIGRKFSNLILPFIGFSVIVIPLVLLSNSQLANILLPENIQTRINEISLEATQFTERQNFYNDALEIWMDYPIFGAGGGAWQTLYEQYQTNPYTSNQAHNFYLQTLVEIGIVGCTLYILFLAIVIYHFTRSFFKKSPDRRHPYLIFWVTAASILVHSIFDFDMSYVFLGAIVFLSLGGILSANELPSFKFQSRIMNKKWKYVYHSLMIIGSIVFMTVSFQGVHAGQLFLEANKAVFQGKPENEIFAYLDEAIEEHRQPEYVDLKINLLNQLFQQTSDQTYASQSQELLDLIKIEEPNYKVFIYRQHQLHLLKKDFAQATATLETAVEKFEWDIKLYEQLSDTLYLQGLDSLQKNDVSGVQNAWQKALDLRRSVERKADELEQLTGTQSTLFGVTANFALPLGQIYYYIGDYSMAENFTKPRIDIQFNDNQDIEAAVFYLASLAKQSRQDPELEEQLFQSFGTEQREQISSYLTHVKSLQPVGVSIQSSR